MTDSYLSNMEPNNRVRGKMNGLFYKGKITSITGNPSTGPDKSFASVVLEVVPEKLQTTEFNIGRVISVPLGKLDLA